MGTQPVGTAPVDDYCRQIETYLCRKNDGHLIRVVGPSFDLVSRWAAQGIPLKVAFSGIDRYFERYYRKGPRRRPIRIDFCEADVLDVFEEWRRAVGIVSREETPSAVQPPARSRPARSLPAHLERALLRLSEARARGAIGPAFDDIIDRVAAELDHVRAGSSKLRGDARMASMERLAALDHEVARIARASLDDGTAAALAREAEDELAAFRSTMPHEGFARARDAAIDRLVRDRLGLPTLSFA